MIGRLLGFVRTRLVLILAVLAASLLAGLGMTVHLWRGAVADAATWHQTSRQLQQTVSDSEAENAKLRDRMRATEKLLARTAAQQHAIRERAQDLQDRLTAAQDAASEAFQDCRRMALPARVLELLQHGADRPDPD